MTVFPYRQPSPRGEGAPKGRIGYRRYERERERASQVDDLRKHPIHRSAVPLPQWGRQIGGGFAEIDDEVAAVLAFVISSATFLAARDDDMGRCPKVVCKSLVMYTVLKGFRVQRGGAAQKTGKRRGVLKYTVFTKDGKPVNLLNLQNLFNL